MDAAQSLAAHLSPSRASLVISRIGGRDDGWADLSPNTSYADEQPKLGSILSLSHDSLHLGELTSSELSSLKSSSSSSPSSLSSFHGLLPLASLTAFLFFPFSLLTFGASLVLSSELTFLVISTLGIFVSLSSPIVGRLISAELLRRRHPSAAMIDMLVGGELPTTTGSQERNVGFI